MSKRYTSKTFPEWTPPLFGWQYRWELNDPSQVLERNRGRIKFASIASPPIFLSYHWDGYGFDTRQWTGMISIRNEDVLLVVRSETLDDLVKKIEAGAKELHNGLGELLGHE